MDTHLTQGAVAQLETDGRYAILLPRYTQQGLQPRHRLHRPDGRFVVESW